MEMWSDYAQNTGQGELCYKSSEEDAQAMQCWIKVPKIPKYYVRLFTFKK